MNVRVARSRTRAHTHTLDRVRTSCGGGGVVARRRPQAVSERARTVIIILVTIVRRAGRPCVSVPSDRPSDKTTPYVPP